MSAVTENNYISNGSQTNYSFTFPYLKTSDITVSLDGVETSNFTFANATTIQLNNGATPPVATAPASGVKIRILRETTVDELTATFYAGSAIKSEDLNDNFTQNLFITQEVNQRYLPTTGGTFTGPLNLGSHKITNLGDPVDAADAVNKQTLDSSIDTAIDNDILAGTDLSKTASGGQVTINHNVAGANTTINNSNGNVIQDISISAQGHVTAAGSTDLDNRYYTETELDAGQLDNRYYTETELDAGQLDNRYYTETELDAGQLDSRYFTETEIANGAADTRYYTETELDAGQLDTRYYTETELDAGALDPLYFRQDSSETISSGQTWSASDNYVATTSAIDARIIDLVDEVGGFDIVNDEQSFPDTNPGGTTGQAAVLSIKAATTNLVPSGTTVTINNGNLANNANITITGVPSTIPSGFGFLVESTSTLHTYTFHRLIPKATEVTTVANNAAEIGRLGTAAAVEDLSILGTTDVVDDLAILGTADVVADLNTLGTADVVADMNTLAVPSVVNNMDTVATNVTNVNNVGGSIANVNTVATNLTDVNNFADTYQIATNDPSTRADGSSLQEGDLYFNTTADELKVYNGGTWQGGVTATGNFAVTTGNTFTGDNTYNDNAKLKLGTDSDLEIFHDTNDSIINDAGTGSLKLQTGGNTKLEITSNGATVTGGVTATSFTGSGANLTSLTAANLTGTIADARFPAVLPAVSGANLTNLPVDLTNLSASNLTSGTIPDARFPAVLPAISAANLTNLPSTGGLTGAGNNELFIESDNVMSSNFTTTTNKNYLNLLPLTINATLTVTDGSLIQFVSA